MCVKLFARPRFMRTNKERSLQPIPLDNEFPVLETPNLRLRRHRLDDFPACRDMWAEPAVTRFTAGHPLTQEEAWIKFQRNAGHWPLFGFGFWVIEEKSTGAFVGEVGVAHFYRETIPPVENLREAGWILAPTMHGKGYATEAVQAALAWADTRLSDPRTMCLIHPENVASLRVAEKCGFREWFRATYHDEPCVLFQRSVPR
jgi:RimJ/RimL family protein N-acetyltransferase